MDLVYLHQYFKFSNESGGTRSYDLAKGFVSQGYTVKIITATSNVQYKTQNRWTLIEKEGLYVYYMYLPYSNTMSFFERTRAFFYFSWFSSLKLLSFKCDLVLATSTPLTIGIPALIKNWRDKTPFIFEIRDVWPEAVIAIGAVKNRLIQKLLYRFEKLIYKKAAAIVALSIDMKRSVQSRYPQFLQKDVLVVENISEISRFQNGIKRPGNLLKELIGFVPRFTILYAGTFGKVNGIAYVIELAKETIKIDPGIVFVLLGNGAEKNNIIELAKYHGLLGKNVFILESVSKDALPQLYFEADMGSSFVIEIKELWANSANKFFDTLASGKPVLINYEGWQKDVIQKNNMGYVLPAKLTKKDINQFVEYTNNDDVIKAQRKNAFTIAMQDYSLEKALDKYNNLIEKITKHNFPD